MKRDEVLAAWKTVSVKEGDQKAADLTIDPNKAGVIEVTIPASKADIPFRPVLTLRPVELDVPTRFFEPAVEVKEGQTVGILARVPAGKYRVSLSDSTADVEVTAGKTSRVRLPPAKK